MRESWKQLLCACIPGRSKSYKPHNGQRVSAPNARDVYLTNESAQKGVIDTLGMSEASGADISFVLDANTLSYQNPMAEDFPDDIPENRKGEQETRSGDDVKVDLSQVEDSEEQKKDTKL